MDSVSRPHSAVVSKGKISTDFFLKAGSSTSLTGLGLGSRMQIDDQPKGIRFSPLPGDRSSLSEGNGLSSSHLETFTATIESWPSSAPKARPVPLRVQRKFWCFNLSVGCFLPAAMAVFLFTSVLCQPAFAQVGRMRVSGQMLSARFIEAPRFVEQELREAERAIAEERMSDAVVRLGELLQRDPSDNAESDLMGQDFFMPTSDQKGMRYSDSKLHRARRLLNELPASALDIYELRYGPLARKYLREAATTRDWQTLRDVRRKYFHTLAGYEASLLLAQNELFTGHPLAASLLLDDVVANMRAINHLGESVKLIHAAAMRQAGRSIDDVQFPTQGQVTVADQNVDWSSIEEPEPWIDARFSSNKRRAGGQLDSYTMLGGSADRNEVSAGQMPLANARWKLETTSTPREARTIEKVADDLIAAGQLPPPSLMPLRVGNHLLMRTTNYLFGVDYRTGKRVWNYPWYSIDEAYDDDQITPQSIGQNNANSLLAQRVWNDLPYGQLTSDGQRVFFVDDLSEVEIVSYSRLGNRGTRPANSGKNTLVALELPSEGSLLWRLGEGADASSSLFDAFFLGPPLPLDGRLYVMAEVAGDILLVCLDPSTGAELWRQQLVAVETGAIDVDAGRRVVGATPTYSDGLLICPTGAGATVAVDLVDRMLRWGVTYARQPRPREVTSRGRPSNTNFLMQRWHHGNAIVVDNSLFLTPAESDSLMCLNLLNGKKKFMERRRDDLRYLAGVRNGQIILVANRYVLALDAETGAEKWRTDETLLSTGQQVVGRGVFGANDYLLPTSSNELVRISLKDGSVLQRRSTRYELGNLVAIDGEVISQGATSLSVAYGEQALEPLVNAQLEADPNNFDALVRKSELLIQHDDRVEALALLKRAREIDPESIEVHMLSVSAMLGLLREGAEGSAEMAKDLEGMIDRPSERVEFLSLQARNAMNAKKPMNAVESLIQLSQLLGKTDRLDNAGKTVINDPTRECGLDSWLAARMNQARQIASDDDVIAINELVKKATTRKLEGATSMLVSLVNHFSAFDVGNVVQALGTRLLKEKSFLMLERTLLGPNPSASDAAKNLSSQRLLWMARGLIGGELSQDALPLIEELKQRDAKDVSAELLDELEQAVDPKLENENSATGKWGKKLSLDWQSSQMPRQGLGMMLAERKQMQTNVLAGETFRGWQLIAEGGNSLAMRNREGRIMGMPNGTLANRETGNRVARISGGLMLLSRGGELTAVDLYKIKGNQGIESFLWQRKFGGDSAASITRRSVPTKFGPGFFRNFMSAPRASSVPREFRIGSILGDRVFVLQGGDLMAVDLRTSKNLWRNSAAPPQGAVVSDGKRVAVVCEPPLSKVVFFDAMDGQELDEQPWDHGTIWTDCGQNLLCFSPTDDRWEYSLQLVNPLSGEVLLKTVAPSANRGGDDVDRSLAKLVNGRYMILLDTNGNLKVWDLLGGVQLIDEKIEAYEDLKAVHGIEMDGQLIVIPERLDSMEADPDGEETQTEHGLFHKTADGLFAFALADGQLRWKREFDKPWGCTLSQPGESPLLLLTRLRWRLDGTAERKMKMDAIAVDVRDGTTLHERLGHQVSSRMNQQQAKIVVQPVQDRVIVQIANEVLSYTFGETDAEREKREASAEKEINGPEPAPDSPFGDPFGN